MGVQEIIAESKKRMELEALKKRNEELDKLLEKLTEAEEKIRQENLDMLVMPDEVNEELQKKAKNDYEKDKEEQEKLFKEREDKRKKLEDEERQLEESFSERVQGSVDENKKWFGYLKRYTLIGIVSGLPGIAIAYLVDKWQENIMVKELYEAHINTIVYPDNIELQKIYQRKRNEFCRVYDIDKIEKLIKESGLISLIKTDRDELIKLNSEIKRANEIYSRDLDLAIERNAELMQAEEEELIKNQEEMDEEFELEIKQI
ncbi:MAG: hypothetical protein Q4G09_00450 [Clostridia bacterium]|nr:hypothetical protein [Clostridia bacterium]